MRALRATPRGEESPRNSGWWDVAHPPGVGGGGLWRGATTKTRATSGSWAGPEVGLVGSELARRWGWHVAGAGRSRGRPGGTTGTAGTEPPRPRHPPLDHPRQQHQPGTHRRPAPTIGPGLRNQVTSRTVRGTQAVASILALGTGWVAAQMGGTPRERQPGQRPTRRYNPTATATNSHVTSRSTVHFRFSATFLFWVRLVGGSISGRGRAKRLVFRPREIRGGTS